MGMPHLKINLYGMFDTIKRRGREVSKNTNEEEKIKRMFEVKREIKKIN